MFSRLANSFRLPARTYTRSFRLKIPSTRERTLRPDRKPACPSQATTSVKRAARFVKNGQAVAPLVRWRTNPAQLMQAVSVVRSGGVIAQGAQG